MAPRAADGPSLDAAAALLAGAARPGLVLGGGARGAAEQCRALAERLGAPVATTANGKGIVDERHPLALGVSLHSPSVQKWLADCDIVLAVGTELAESDLWSTPPALDGRLIRVDVDPAQMYAGLPADVALVGDAQRPCRRSRSGSPGCRPPRPRTRPRGPRPPCAPPATTRHAHVTLVGCRISKRSGASSQPMPW
ncbi:hypothetical protein ACFQ0Q_34860 [Streptomyces aureus]